MPRDRARNGVWMFSGDILRYRTARLRKKLRLIYSHRSQLTRHPTIRRLNASITKAARSRTSGEYFFACLHDHILSEVGASAKPEAVQVHSRVSSARSRDPGPLECGLALERGRQQQVLYPRTAGRPS